MPDTEWHLDKRVPVALILTLVMQAAAFGWFGAQLDGRLTVAERDILRLSADATTMARAAQQQAVQLGRIEESITGMRTDINRLIRALEER